MRVVLCCGKSGCPVLEFKDGFVEIHSESGTAKLTKDEWELLVSKIKNGELQSC
jgi:hypothetical protein